MHAKATETTEPEAHLTDEEKKIALAPSVDFIDMVSSTAIDMALHFVQNRCCPESSSLLSQPEAFAIRAMEAAVQ
jgi:hypothetical protein